jgi:hypothetical protein
VVIIIIFIVVVKVIVIVQEVFNSFRSILIKELIILLYPFVKMNFEVVFLVI